MWCAASAGPSDDVSNKNGTGQKDWEDARIGPALNKTTVGSNEYVQGYIVRLGLASPVVWNFLGICQVLRPGLYCGLTRRKLWDFRCRAVSLTRWSAKLSPSAETSDPPANKRVPKPSELWRVRLRGPELWRVRLRGSELWRVRLRRQFVELLD